MHSGMPNKEWRFTAVSKIAEEFVHWSPHTGYVSVMSAVIEEGKYRKLIVAYVNDEFEVWDGEIIEGEKKCLEFLDKLYPNALGAAYETIRQLLSDMEEGTKSSPETVDDFKHQVRVRLGL